MSNSTRLMEESDFKHKLNHKMDKPSHSCLLCEKVFSRECSFERHLTQAHGLDHPCFVCKRGFKSKAGLISHKRRLSCKEVTQERQKTGHVKASTRNGIASQQPYDCRTCGRRFKSERGLATHSRVHRDQNHNRLLSTETCSKSIQTLSALVSHETNEAGQKLHRYAVCKKAFLSLSSLKRHERLHTGEKPYQCSVCEKAFSDSSSCRKHERRCKTDKSHLLNKTI